MQKRIDLGGRVPDHGVGQGGQQPEVVGGLVEASQLVKVVLRMARFVQQRREDPQYVLFQLAGRLSVAALPWPQLAGKPVAQPPFVHGLEDLDQRLLVLLSAVDGHVPVGQGAVVLGPQLVVGLDRLEQRDGRGDLSLLRQQVAQREPPAVVGIIDADPLSQVLFQLLGPVQGHEQLVLEGFPADVLRIGGRDRLVDVAQQPVDRLRRGRLAGGQVGQRHQVPRSQHLVELPLQIGLGVGRRGCRRLGTQQLPARLLDPIQVPAQQHFEVQPFDIHPLPDGLRMFTPPIGTDCPAKPIGKPLPGEPQVLLLLFAQLDPRQLFLMLDLGHAGAVAGLHHAVGQAVDGLDFGQQLLGRLFGLGEPFQQSERLVFILGRPWLAQECVEQLVGVAGPMLLGTFLQLPAEEGEVLFGRQPAREDLHQRLGQLLLDLDVLFRRPTFLQRDGDSPPHVCFDRRIVRPDPAHQSLDLVGRQRVDLGREDAEHLLADPAALIAALKLPVAHDLVGYMGSAL